MAELARLRGTSLTNLMKELDIRRPAHVEVKSYGRTKTNYS